MMLTIGMAHFDDYDGVYFSLQALAMYQDLDDTEIVIVDNSPHSGAGEAVRNLATWVPRTRYVPYADAVGTSRARDRIFEEARGDCVLVMDCHVLLRPHAIRRLKDYFASRPQSLDLVSGPLWFDDLRNSTTHFDPRWRGEMWGTWGQAWACPCGRPFAAIDAPPASPPVSVSGETPTVSAGVTAYWSLPDSRPLDRCDCGREWPVLPWPGHEAALEAAGYCRLGGSPDEAPFEIPGHGLGLFACRREAWPGFHPLARGFGGEELYIHEKVRRRGGRNLCLPWLGWLHRFGRPSGVKYPLDRYAKVRNYVLEFQELNWSLDPVHEHFVRTGLMSTADWDHLTANPAQHDTPPTAASACGTCGGASGYPLPPVGADLDGIYKFVRAIPRDLQEHMDRVRELASDCQHVTALVKRREWDAAILAGRPTTFISYQAENDPLAVRLHEAVAQAQPVDGKRTATFTSQRLDVTTPVPAIAETDMLVIDTVHSADRLYHELIELAPRVRRWIVLRGTQTFGEIGEPGGPGLLPALRRYMREHREWSVISHHTQQYGLTVLSRLAADKPQLPGVIQMAANFTAAMAAHVADGANHVDAEVLRSRLEICTLCDQRREDRCAVCGCFIDTKATWRTSECPLGRWPALEAGTETVKKKEESLA